MRRSKLTWVTAALAALLAVPAHGGTIADEGNAPAADSPPSSETKSSAKAANEAKAPAEVTPQASESGASSSETVNEMATGGEKVLHTIPEDGGADDLFPASSRLVRDLVAVRPKEDLIICIAGCVQGVDRVVYSQPSDPHRKPAVVPVTEAQPQPAPAAEMAKPKPEASKVPATSAPNGAAEKPTAANSGKDGKETKDANAHMEPASSQAPAAPVAAVKPAADSKKPELAPANVAKEGNDAKETKAHMEPTSSQAPVAAAPSVKPAADNMKAEVPAVGDKAKALDMPKAETEAAPATK